MNSRNNAAIGSPIHFDAKRIYIVDISKTEHQKRRAIRAIPLLPQMETELLKLHLEAEDGSEYLFPDLNADSNLRTTLEKIIRRGTRSTSKITAKTPLFDPPEVKPKALEFYTPSAAQLTQFVSLWPSLGPSDRDLILLIALQRWHQRPPPPP